MMIADLVHAVAENRREHALAHLEAAAEALEHAVALAMVDAQRPRADEDSARMRTAGRRAHDALATLAVLA